MILLWFVYTVLAVTLLADGTSRYPTVVWHPMNPLFGCEHPRINVKIDDRLNLQCPTEEYNFFQSENLLTALFENMHFLGTDRERYQNCNATGI